MSEGADRAAIAALRAAWMAAVASGDAEALRDLLTDDYEVWANAAPPIVGIDAAIGAMRGALARFRVEQRFDAVETIVAGDWAFERGTESMRVTPRGGGDSRDASQRALLVLRRGIDGRWRFARGMTNQLPVAGE